MHTLIAHLSHFIVDTEFVQLQASTFAIIVKYITYLGTDIGDYYNFNLAE
jgi:hypothetical protein